MSGHGDGGPYVKNDNTTVEHHAGIIFVSYDNAKTWSTLYKKFGSGAPYVITSTFDWPLIAKAGFPQPAVRSAIPGFGLEQVGRSGTI